MGYAWKVASSEDVVRGGVGDVRNDAGPLLVRSLLRARCAKRSVPPRAHSVRTLAPGSQVPKPNGVGKLHGQ
jgi:hypothetical protein